MEFRSLLMALEHDKPSQVTTLNLSNQHLSELPKEIGRLQNLRVLNLEQNNLTTLPEEIGELKNLTTLILNSNNLTTLPFSMKNLSNLMKLEIKRNDLSEFPDIFEKMNNLRGLYAKKNRLNSLPPSFRFLNNLQVLDVRQNGYTKLPAVIFHLPNLDNIQGIMGEGHTSPKEIITSFNTAFNKTALDSDQYREAFTILSEDSSDLPLSNLLILMQINFAMLRTKVIEKMLLKSQNTPLESNMMVCVLGNTSINKQEIKEKLKELRIGYDTKITPKTTHIVLGNLPKLVGEVDKNKKYTIWLEKDLNNYFEIIDKPYLLEVSEEATEQKVQIGRLLLSADVINIGIAVQILKGGGVPENIIEEVFLAYKICDDSKIKLELKKLLQINANTSVMDALSKKDLLFDPKRINAIYQKEETEKDIFKALKKYSAFSNDLDWCKIAYLIQENFGYGARFVFTYDTEGSERRRTIIEQNVIDCQLDYNKIYSKGQPDLTFAYTYPYYTPRPIPGEIFTQTQLKSLNLSGCYVASISEKITDLKQLTQLNLANNFIQKLPSNFEQLSNLKVLDISQNEFDKFPIEIAQISQLEICIIKNNRKKWDPKPIIIPQEIKDALPNCSFEN